MRAPDAVDHPYRAPHVAPSVRLPSLRLSDTTRADDGPEPARALLAHADQFRHAESWLPAIAAYRAAIAGATDSTDHMLLAEAHLRLGFCLRMAGDLGAAAEAYAAANTHAQATRDIHRALLSRVGAAVVVASRGNLPAAAMMLEAVVLEAEALVSTQPGLVDAIARAKHDRGTIAHDRGDPARAVVDLYDAYHLYGDSTQRDRVLIDLARAFADLDLIDVARDALRLCHAGAAGPAARTTAAINLLDIAQREGDEAMFEHHRRALAHDMLVPRHAAFYHLFAGEGLRRFGHLGAAHAAFAQARDIAAHHGLGAVLIRADAALADGTGADSPPHAHAPRTAPAPVQRVAAGIAAMFASSPYADHPWPTIVVDER